MKILRNKKTTQKIIIILLFLTVFNFILPTYSKAEFWGGGTLFDPIRDLVCGIGDAVENVLQSIFLPGSPKAVDKRTIASLVAEMERQSGDGFLSDLIAGHVDAGDWLINNTWVLGDFFGWASNGIGNFFSSITGIGEQDQVKDLYQEKVIPIIIYGPATIFSNKVPALDVNFINPNVTYVGGEVNYELGIDEDGKFVILNDYEEDEASTDPDKMYEYNTAYQLRDTISTWYVALRNIAIVGLLSVLVYVGIRIIMSSTAGETAKYKSMLKDWLIAMCILFFIHYMMAFLLKTTELFTDLFMTENIISSESTDETQVQGVQVDTFMNGTRLLAQNATDAKGDQDAGLQFGYTIVYFVLIFYTVIFTWKYLKRFVYLAFLTMISPMVALTYPIDKIKDGNAQAFNMWFKEYVFNVLIQPLHLLLYSILITSAGAFAEKNVIYTIVAIGFLLEAEKIVKSMFGFTKAEGGILSSAVTGGAIFGTVASLLKGGASKLTGGKGTKGGKGSASGNSGDSKIHYSRQADSGSTSGLAAFGGESSGGLGSGGSSGTGGTGTLGAGGSGVNPKYNTALFNKASNTYGKAKNALGAPGRAISNKASSVGSSISASPLGTFGKGVSNLGRDIAKTKPARMIKGVGKVAGRFVNKDNAKKALKLAAMGAGAATFGTIGLAAGIASGDSSDILKTAGIGAGAGALLGNASVDAADSIVGSVSGGASGVKDSYQQGYFGEDYVDKVLNPRLDKEWKQDKDVVQHFKNKYGNAYKKKMDDALKLRKTGITDQDEIDSAIKLMDKNPTLSTDRAANIVQFSKGLNRADLLNQNTRKSLSNRVSGMTGNNKATTDQIMDLLDQKFKLK